MSDYKPGTLLEDRDEDQWRVNKDGTLTQTLDDPEREGGAAIDKVEKLWGPLKVVSEPTQWIITNPISKETADLYYGSFNRAVDEGPAVRKFVSNVPAEVVEKATASSGDSFPENAFSVYHEAFNILLKKNADYGPSNIADSPGGPLNGILVRMWDKMSRLRHLVESGATPENESLRDTLMDMANYSLIAMIVLDGNWPGMEGDK